MLYSIYDGVSLTEKITQLGQCTCCKNDEWFDMSSSAIEHEDKLIVHNFISRRHRP